MSSPPTTSPDRPAEQAVGSPLHSAVVLHHAIFMPRADEPIHAYAARLRALHHHLTMLLEAVERGMGHRTTARQAMAARDGRAAEAPRVVMAHAPTLAPVPGTRIERAPADAEPAERRRKADGEPAAPGDRRGRLNRRSGLRDRRRLGHPDRRRGMPDLRADKIERRVGPPDRRSGRRDRRLGHDRRVDARRVAPVATPPQVVDPVAVFWGVNIVCWLAIVAVAMVWGVG